MMIARCDGVSTDIPMISTVASLLLTARKNVRYDFNGFTWTLPSDKPLRTTNEIVSYIDANGNQCKVQAEVKYYGMGHDPLWTIAIPNVVEAENECVCESLL